MVAVHAFKKWQESGASLYLADQPGQNHNMPQEEGKWKPGAGRGKWELDSDLFSWGLLRS